MANEEAPKIVRVHLIAGGQYHDIDYVRMALLQRLSDFPNVRARVDADYSSVAALDHADALITYTCNVTPRAEDVTKLRDFLENGGRWLALHGTNSILAQNENNRWYAPEDDTGFMELLGSQFAAHPPLAPYKVMTVKDDDPLVAGIGDFEVEGGDELYYMRLFGDIDVLMDAGAQGAARGFVEREWPDEARFPVLYRKKHGPGEILYLTPGHRRGHFDMQPLVDYYPDIEKGAWEQPAFVRLLGRCLAWAVGGNTLLASAVQADPGP